MPCSFHAVKLLDVHSTWLVAGASRPQVRRPARHEQLLGGPGLDIQVLRDRHGRPTTQGDPSRPGHELALQGRRQAPRVAWPHVRRQEVAWSRKGTSLQRYDRRLATRQLEAQQQSVAAQETIDTAIFWLSVTPGK